MKKLLILLLIWQISEIAYTQENILGSHFIYEVKRAVYSQDINGNLKKVDNLNYEGHIYSAGNENIYFEKPLYLAKYPKGEIITYKIENDLGILDISIDSQQYLNYFNFENNFRIIRINIGKNSGYNLSDTLIEIKNIFKLQNEYKIIYGINCQKAILGDLKDPDWTLWISNDVKLQFNFIYPFSPGAIFEGYSKNNDVEIKLLSYNLFENFQPNVFKPDKFKEPIKQRKK